MRTSLRTLALAALLVSSLVAFAGAALAESFTNANPISTPLPGPPPGCPPSCPSERATPYPSTISVSGMSGTVTDVNVTLNDLVSQFDPPDDDILLVGPDGKSVMLMSDACGDNDNENPITSAVTITFDDQAPAPLPADAPCSSGTFRPIDDDDDSGEFPAHGHPDDAFPGGPTPPAGTLPLSTFNRSDPNGAWNLYMVDDYPNDPNPNGFATRIAGGWTLVVSSSGSAQPTASVAAQAPPAQTQTTARSATQTTQTTRLTGTTTTTARGATTSTTRAGATTSTTRRTAMAQSGSTSGPLLVTGAVLLLAGVAMVGLTHPAGDVGASGSAGVYQVRFRSPVTTSWSVTFTQSRNRRRRRRR